MSEPKTDKHPERVPKPGTLDHRLAERLDVSLPLTLQMPEGNTLETTTLDISGGGLQFVSGTALDPGQECTIDLSLPDHTKPLRFAAYVVRCADGPTPDNPFVVAIHFNMHRCSKTTFAVFSQFIAKQLLIKYLG